jgi:AcrR family transcriptional regulator
VYLVNMRRSSFRHEEITNVAVELAEQEGVGGVTTAALARRLKFTEAALYRHFPGKNAILAAALRYLGERLLATMLLELSPEAAGRTADVVAQLERHIKRFALAGGLLLEFLLHAATTRGVELRDEGAAFLAEYVTRIEAYFGLLEETGVVTEGVPPKELARLWLCQLMGGFVRARLLEEDWDPVTQPGYAAFVAGLASAQGVAAT